MDFPPPETAKTGGKAPSFLKLGWENGWDAYSERDQIMKKTISLLLCLLSVLLCLQGCARSGRPSAGDPVVLTMWHVYGSQTESPLNVAIDRFNNTVGKENGVTINVVSVTSSSAIDEALSASANGEPGAEELPDLFTAYPRVAEIVGTDRLLAWDSYFTEEELAAFHGEFLSEGFFGGKLLMLPIAKSTEAFYLNKTLFDRFSADTGVTADDLRTVDGMLHTAKIYYDWSGGQNFMQINDFYHYAYVGMKSFGSEWVVDGELQMDATFERIWNPLAETAIYGGICLEDGYAASRWKTVEVISNIGSTADVLYQPHEVVYADNTTEAISTVALPYPVFRKDAPGVVYRGGGLFAVQNSDERKNYGAYLFAKWLAEEKNNLSFVTEAGYLPVTDAALDTLFRDLSVVKNANYHSLYRAVDTMVQDYEMYALPLYDGASKIQLDFEKNVKAVLKAARVQYLKRVHEGEAPSRALHELTAASLNELRSLSARQGA